METNLLQFSERDNTLFCLFTGKLDGYVCSEIEQDLLQSVSQFKSRHETIQIVFDLTEVVYISSAFLRICLICHRTMGCNSFSITNASEPMYNVFRISGFAEMMNVTPAIRTPETA